VPHAVEVPALLQWSSPGRKLVIADYSQIELRILGGVSGDRGFKDAFNSARICIA
jgi:DNA polymerase I-like protein with 3'-5' exonuclease and polymerase domains